MRHYFVLAHRYLGLVMMLFLIIAGLTGSLLTFYNELDHWVLAHYIKIPPDNTRQQQPSLPALDPIELRHKILAAYPNAAMDWVNLEEEASPTRTLSLSPSSDNTELANDEVFVDAATGSVLAARKWGDPTQGWINLMPFIYRLHTSLALGTFGVYCFGIIALLWSIDCFIGAYLTFPARRKTTRTAFANTYKPPGKNTIWIKRWWKSWKVRMHGGNYKLYFDLHRAGGLWPWAMLFVLAWSSVGMNLQEVFNPVMQGLFDMKAVKELPQYKTPVLHPGIDWREAKSVGEKLMQQEAASRRFSIINPQTLYYDNTRALYQYRVKSSLDIAEKYGSTSVFFDANTGQLKDISLPSGETNGDTITSWLFALHMGAIWGIPYRIFLCVVGIIIAMLSITGFYVWWKKRRARKHARNHADRTKKLAMTA